MSEETKNTAQEEETTDTPVTEETVENEPEVVENGEAETEEIPVEDGDEEASQDDKKDSKSKTSFFGKKKKEKDKFEQQIEELKDSLNLMEQKIITDQKRHQKIQEEVKKCWKAVTTDTVKEYCDIDGYWEDFYHMFGFRYEDIDYTQDVDAEKEIDGVVM